MDHAGYTSVYTVDGEKGNLGHLQETYLPAMGANWATQDLTSQTQSPGVAPDTTPSALYHDGFDSVYTVAEGSGDLQETYLRALGDTWLSQDLTNSMPWRSKRTRLNRLKRSRMASRLPGCRR